jgi:5-methylcytosine-specific restriction endonuclease McrA
MSKPYAKAFYKSKQWQAVRREVLRRDLYMCQDCKVNRAEEVHHIQEITPENIGDPNITLNPNNLTSLCHTCHTKITQGANGDIVSGYCFDENGQVVQSPPTRGK